METFKNYILDNYLAIIGIVISTFFATYYYFKSKKVKCPTYTLTSFPLLNSEIKKIDNLEVKYFGETVQNLTATKFAFWNAGNDTINKSDIPENSPLRIKAKEGITIYSVEVIFCSDLSNNIFPIIKKGTYIFDYDYLDRNQGCIVKILHSGNSSIDIVVSGKIKGVGDFKKAKNLITRTPIYPILILSFLILISLFGMINSSHLFLKILFLNFIILLLVSLVANLWGTRFPKDLAKKFNE